MNLQPWKPSVEKRWLLLLSGAMWTVAGVLLCLFAFDWLRNGNWNGGLSPALAGAVLALVIYRFGLSRLASRNIGRICLMREMVCLFAFLPWKSYLIVAVMMGMGITLRNSEIPKTYLATLYVGMGGALFLSSLHYYRQLVREGL